MQFIVIFEVFGFLFSPSVQFMFLCLIGYFTASRYDFLGLVYSGSLGKIVNNVSVPVGNIVCHNLIVNILLIHVR